MQSTCDFNWMENGTWIFISYSHPKRALPGSQTLRRRVKKMNGLKKGEPPAWLLFHCFIDIMIKKKEGERERVDDAET